MSRARKKLEEMGLGSDDDMKLVVSGQPLSLQHIEMWKRRCPDVHVAARGLAKAYGVGVFPEDVEETLYALYAAKTPEDIAKALENDMSGVTDVLTSWLP